MISFCESVSLSREKFSDFDLLDPAANMKNVFLAGYYLDEDGERVNIKVPAGYFINTIPDSTVSDLKPDSKTSLLTILDRTYGGQPIKLARLNYVPGQTFYQFNNIDESLYNEIRGNKFFCIKITKDAPLGQEYKLYFSNVPPNHGVLLFPLVNTAVKDTKPVELFVNADEENNDYFVHLIQLVDPKKNDGSLFTKVLSIEHFTPDDEKTYLTFSSSI